MDDFSYGGLAVGLLGFLCSERDREEGNWGGGLD